MASPARSKSAPDLEAAKNIIMRWDSAASEEARDRMIFDSAADREEALTYLRAVDEIQRSLSSVALSDDSAGAIQIAMARLEDEFRSVLVSHSTPVEMESLISRNSSSLSQLEASIHDSDFGQVQVQEEEVEGDREGEEIGGERRRRRRDEEEGEGEEEGSSRRSSSSYLSTNSISVGEVELIPSDAVFDLRCIAERMIAAGYKRECFQVYGSVRKSAVDGSLRQLGVEKLSIGDVHRLDWEALETKIRRWIRAARVCVRVLFASERRLCERIFGDFSAPEDEEGEEDDEVCFMETVKSGAIQLFNFAEAISISRRSPEKLFKILDLHDALSDLLPEIAAVFRSKPSESVRVQAAEIVARLAEAARGILSEFENAVEKEPSRVAVPGGTIHPLTRYVMNYLILISEYKQTLSRLITTKPSRFSDDAHLPEFDLPAQEEELPPLALHVLWIIVSLQSNLESKAEVYRDNALPHLFLMNNVHYIVQKVKGSPELGVMIGDDYLRRLKGKLRQSATSYQRAAWMRILHCLRDEGLHVGGGFSSGISKAVLRERFKAFNASFEEAHRVQATWSVPDSQVREELRIFISELLLPAYRSFLGRYRHHVESGGRHSDTYIKYSVEDLESALLDFFEGHQAAPHIRRRSN